MQRSAQPSDPHLNSNAWNLLFAGIAAACVMAVLIMQMFANANSAISLAILTILVSGYTTVWQFRRHGLDPLALFCLGFLLYDGLLLLRITLLSGTSALIYPISFESETYAAAGALCVVAAIAVLLTTFVWEITFGQINLRKPEQTFSRISAAWFWAGLCAYTGGIALYYLQFEQFGGYIASLALSRGERFELAADSSHLSFPYTMFIVPGIACLCYGSQLSGSKFRRCAFYGLATFWCLLVLLQGDRRLVLQTLLTIAGVLVVMRPDVFRFRVRTWILLISAYCFFTGFGYARDSIATIVSGQISSEQAIAEFNNAASSDWFTPEHTEFAGPYLSLLVAVSSHSATLFGSSYYESLFTVLPRFMYPGEKPVLVSEQFARQMHIGTGAVSGWGYNPVAEAYLNFGAFGVVFIFVLWALYFLALRSIRRFGECGILLAAVLLSEAINVNRIDFRNIYWETTYLFAGLALTSVIAILLKALFRRLAINAIAVQPIG